MGYLTDALKASENKFLCGDDVSIADLHWFTRLRRY